MKKLIRKWFGLEEHVCLHDWELATRTYAPPTTSLPTTTTDPHVLEKALFGLTSYMWECHSCGSLRTQEMLGSDEQTPLHKIIENVEREGMQYIRENGQVYAIAKWVPQTSTNLVPVK